MTKRIMKKVFKYVVGNWAVLFFIGYCIYVFNWVGLAGWVAVLFQEGRIFLLKKANDDVEKLLAEMHQSFIMAKYGYKIKTPQN